MAQQTINLGTVANDGTGDTVRVAGGKINDNFTELYGTMAALGGSWKSPVRVATTAAGTLASSFENGDTVDGVTLVTGDRILLKNQASGAENGIYTVNASGAPTRATDADSSTDLVNATVSVSEGTANADTIWQCTTNATITVGATALVFTQITSGSGSTINQGVHTIPIGAGAMTGRTTNGAASGLTESTTNKVMTRTLDFDASTAEYAQISIPMLKSWDEGTITVQFVWTSTATGNVVWAAQAQVQRDDDPLDGAWGTAQSVTDGVTAANDRMNSAYTAAITPAGTAGNECSLLIQVYRDAASGSDTCAVDAKLIGIRVKYTVNAGDDS